jgi:hypothetical protein
LRIIILINNINTFQQKRELEDYFNKKGGTEAFKILAHTNYSQLRKTFQQMNVEIEKILLNKEGHFWVCFSLDLPETGKFLISIIMWRDTNSKSVLKGQKV